METPILNIEGKQKIEINLENSVSTDIKKRSFSYNELYYAIKFAIWNEPNYADEKGMINIDDVINDAINDAINNADDDTETA